MENESCPCKHTAPCDPNCTCVEPFSSRGCARCCTYGSPEQQKASSERLAKLEHDLEITQKALLRACNETKCGDLIDVDDFTDALDVALKRFHKE